MSAPAPSMFTPAAKAMAEKLGLKLGRANLDEFAATLQSLAEADPNLIAVTSDSRGSGKLAPFGKALPKQLVEVGSIDPDCVHTPGIYVKRVLVGVAYDKPIEQRTVRKRAAVS